MAWLFTTTRLRVCHTGLLILGLGIQFTSCTTRQVQLETSDYVSTGNEYARDGLFREAIDQYRRALSENPNNHSARRNIGVVSVRIGDYKNAIRHLEQSLPRFSDNFDTNFYLAEAYRAEENFAQAIFYYQSALRLRKDEPRALKALAWSYYKIRYYSEALTIAEQLKTQSASDMQASIILARTLLKLKKHREALVEIRRAKSQTPQENHAFLQSIEGDALSALGRCDHAMRLYRTALRQDPSLGGALLGLGKCHISEGRLDRGIEYVERAVRVRPSLAEGYYVLGQALETSDPKKSLQFFRLFLRHAASDPEYIGLATEVRSKLGQLSRPQARPAH